MKENKLVSIIIPAYNVEKYLETCLESIKIQTYKNLEVIVIDDGSTDNTGMVCKKFEDNDERFRIIHTKNGGVSKARNLGLSEANGDYIVFVDSDDYINYRCIERLVCIIEKSNADIAVCDFYRIYSTNQSLMLKEEIEKDYKIIKDDDKFFMLYNEFKPRIVVPWCKIYKKEILNGIIYPEGKVHEDAAVIANILLNAQTIATFDEKLFFYLKRKESITQKLTRDRLAELENLKERHPFFIKNLKNEKLINENALKICECTIRCYKNVGILNLRDKKNIQKNFYKDYVYYYKNFVYKKSLSFIKRIQLFLFYRFHFIYNFVYLNLSRICIIINRK